MTSIGPITVGVVNTDPQPQSVPLYDSGQTADTLTTYSFSYTGSVVGYQGPAGHVNAVWRNAADTVLRTDSGPQINWGVGPSVVLSGTAPAGATRLQLVFGASLDPSGIYASSSASCTLNGSFARLNVPTAEGQADAAAACCAANTALLNDVLAAIAVLATAHDPMLDVILASVRTTYSTT